MTLLIGIALGVAGIAAVGLFVWRRVIIGRAAASNPDEDEEWPLPPLFVPPELARAAATAARARAADGAIRVEPVHWTPAAGHGAPAAHSPESALGGPAPATASPPITRNASPLVTPPAVAPPAAVPTAVTPPPVRTPPPAPTTVPLPPLSTPPAPGEAIAAELPQQVRVGQVRFHRLPEGTLQLLPGRLEILRGTERIEEIRFVRVPGREAVVTFGRSEGEPHKHVQLEARTVSRQHASMRFSEGHWQITNLSRTNPVVVNGEPLAAGDEAARVLTDGDQLEMGEVVFRFRAR